MAYVGEMPWDFPTADGPAERVAATDRRFADQPWRVVRVPHQTEADAGWAVRGARVRFHRDRRPMPGESWLIVARSRATAEVKYFASNAGADVPVARLVLVAFTRWNVEQAFRLAKAEAGLTHYEGRSYVGLTRLQVLCLVVVGFVTAHADGLRGKNPEVTAEQVCRALNARCGELLARGRGTSVIAHTAEVIQYHQRRNKAARTSKRRRNRRPKLLAP